MEEKQQEVAKTMLEIVEEAKDMTRQYYESQLKSLRTEVFVLDLLLPFTITLKLSENMECMRKYVRDACVRTCVCVHMCCDTSLVPTHVHIFHITSNRQRVP